MHCPFMGPKMVKCKEKMSLLLICGESQWVEIISKGAFFCIVLLWVQNNFRWVQIGLEKSKLYWTGPKMVKFKEKMSPLLICGE